MKKIIKRLIAIIPFNLKLLRLLEFLGVIKVKVAKTQKDKNRFNDIWQAIWLEQSYATPEDIEAITRHYASYDNFSTDFLLFLVGQAIGTVRIINSDITPVFQDFQIDPDWLKEKKKVVEVTLLTVKKEFRSLTHLASLFLIRCCFQYVIKHNLDGVIVAADQRLFLMLKRLRFSIVEIGQKKYYEGSLTIPAYIDLQKTKQNLERHNSNLCKFLTT